MWEFDVLKLGSKVLLGCGALGQRFEVLRLGIDVAGLGSDGQAWSVLVGWAAPTAPLPVGVRISFRKKCFS